MKYRIENTTKRELSQIYCVVVKKYKLLKRASQNLGIYIGIKAMKKRGTVTSRQKNTDPEFLREGRQ